MKNHKQKKKLPQTGVCSCVLERKAYEHFALYRVSSKYTDSA